MSTMTAERLHDLFDENREKDLLTWSGPCHDCGEALVVTATPASDGIHIVGGCVYEPLENRFFMKCDVCFKKDAVLRNYQDCEVYSRVVGYLRPVAQWNDGKQSEYAQRRTFDSSLV